MPGVKYYGDGSQMPLPPEEETPDQGLLARLLAKLLPAKGDVYLPNESGVRDARLPAASNFENLKTQMEGIAAIGKPANPAQGAMESLRRSAGVLKK